MGWWETRQTETVTAENTGTEKSSGEFLPCHLEWPGSPQEKELSALQGGSKRLEAEVSDAKWLPHESHVARRAVGDHFTISTEQKDTVSWINNQKSWFSSHGKMQNPDRVCIFGMWLFQMKYKIKAGRAGHSQNYAQNSISPEVIPTPANLPQQSRPSNCTAQNSEGDLGGRGLWSLESKPGLK